MTTYWWSSSSGTIELEFTDEQLDTVSLSGQASSWVNALLEEASIRKQLDELPDDFLSEELYEWGAWEWHEVQDRRTNEQRLIWIAASDAREERDFPEMR